MHERCPSNSAEQALKQAQTACGTRIETTANKALEKKRLLQTKNIIKKPLQRVNLCKGFFFEF